MSQKTNPITFRLGLKRTWLSINHISNWFKPWIQKVARVGRRQRVIWGDLWLEYCIRRLIKGILIKKGWYTSEIVIKTTPQLCSGGKEIAILVARRPGAMEGWRKVISRAKLKQAIKISTMLIEERYGFIVKLTTRIIPRVEWDATIWSISIGEALGPILKKAKKTGELRPERGAGGYLRKLLYRRRSPR